MFDRRGREKTQKRRNEPGKKNLKPVVSKISISLWWGAGNLQVFARRRREDPEKKERTGKEEPRAGWLATYQKVLEGGTYKYSHAGEGRTQKRRNETRENLGPNG